MSPSSITRAELSWNQGFVRGPDDRSRVSIHSPPRRMFSACRIAQRSFSVMPGFSVSSMTRIDASQAAIAAAHGLQLVGALHRARVLHHLFAGVDGDAELGERDDAIGIDAVDREPRIAAAAALQKLGDLGRPATRAFRSVLARLIVVPGRAVADLVDAIEMPGEMLAIVKVPEDHRAFGRDEGVAHRVVRAPKLHVGGIGRVADVERIVDDDAGEIAFHQFGADARQAIASRDSHVRRIESARQPIRPRQARHSR